MKYYLGLTLHPRVEDTLDYRFYMLRESEEGLVGNFLGPGTRLLITASPTANLDGAMAIERTGVRQQIVQGGKGTLIIVDGYVPLEQMKAIHDHDGLVFFHRCVTKFGFKKEEHVAPWPFRVNLHEIGERKRSEQCPPQLKT